MARSGGWGWHLGDEGSGFWIGEHAIRNVLRAADGRGPATLLEKPLFEHFGIERPEQIVRALYDRDYPRHQVAMFAVRVEEAAGARNAVAGRILAAASEELVLAARSVIGRLDLEAGPYDVVLCVGGHVRLPCRLYGSPCGAGFRLPARESSLLAEEPAMGAVRLALEELEKQL